VLISTKRRFLLASHRTLPSLSLQMGQYIDSRAAIASETANAKAITRKLRLASFYRFGLRQFHMITFVLPTPCLSVALRCSYHDAAVVYQKWDQANACCDYSCMRCCSSGELKAIEKAVDLRQVNSK